MNIKCIIIIISLLALVAITILFLKSPYRIAIFKSKSHFEPMAITPTVLYESGAEKYADRIAAYLDIAINTVEKEHYLPFKKPFNVYVCNSQKSMNEYLADKPWLPIRGTALRGDVYIAPVAFNFKGYDTHKETLTHELSHLHIQQRLSFPKRRKIPLWFHEGFGDYIANSGGEGISEEDATNNILIGNHFNLIQEGNLLSSFKDELNGLSHPMYHKQVKMFVTYLIESDAVGFKSFILEIQKGKSFPKSFSEAYEMSIDEKWDQFVSYLEYKK